MYWRCSLEILVGTYCVRRLECFSENHRDLLNNFWQRSSMVTFQFYKVYLSGRAQFGIGKSSEEAGDTLMCQGEK